jgi:GNAT superfamily N-acetyltransferase
MLRIMEIREARMEDAEESCAVIQRSIAELCEADHQGDAPTISLWLANKTAENMRRWIAQTYVFVATEGGRIVGVGAITRSGEITLNYVLPDARFRGISKSLLRRMELQASELGVRTLTLQSSLTALRFYGSAGYRRDGPPTKGFGITFGHPMMKKL